MADPHTPGYDTIQRVVDTEIEISRSRFLTRLARVNDEAEAREIIARVKAEHPRARHHCTAFVLGADQRVQRSSDDGEPSGTAGAPMLEALVSARLSDVVAVVTRYFGGVLLGAGGLTRAYRGAVAEATAQAKRQRRECLTPVRVRASYDTSAQIEAEARRRGYVMGESKYAADVTHTILIGSDQLDSLIALAQELTSGQAKTVVSEAAYVDV